MTQLVEPSSVGTSYELQYGKYPPRPVCHKLFQELVKRPKQNNDLNPASVSSISFNASSNILPDII